MARHWNVSGITGYRFLLWCFLAVLFSTAARESVAVYNLGAFWRAPAPASSSSGSLNYDEWTWISGSNTVNQAGVYGTKGTADPTNIPGARYSSISWVDSSDTLWLFGGWAYDSTGLGGRANDLWKWDGTHWTWVSGSDARGQSGSYGTKGVADPSNIPGARTDSNSWIDSSGTLWLFGGSGLDSAGSVGRLNDLWKWDGTNWTWVSGSNTINQSGTYGTKGVADPSNIPGARESSTSWVDSSNALWFFGGYGLDSAGNLGRLNDLWKWDGTNWTWVSGSNAVNQSGSYGTKGTADPANLPGARSEAISWIDSSGTLWLFGGEGYDSAGNLGRLNDLWKWDGTNWTWASGSDTRNQYGSYGTQGVADPSNIPGARREAVSWTDSFDTLWLFGGYGMHSTSIGRLNDLWKWDGTNWTWVSGTDTGNQSGSYGTKGTADPSNIPGARTESISWIDSSGTLWLFGGYGYDSAGTVDWLNDLWKATENIYFKNSTITGTGPVTADGVDASTITITLKKKDGTAASGITPTFSATDTGTTNAYGACSSTDVNGVSTCSLTSTRAEIKTLSITYPLVKTGGTVTFEAGPATKLGFSTEPVGEYIGQDFFTMPVVAIQDGFGNTVPGTTDPITLSASTLSDCSNTAAGTLSATANPLSATDGVAAFSGVQYDTAEAIYLKATATGLTSACSIQVRFRKTIAFVAGEVVTSGGSATSLSINVPAGTASGDVMIAALSVRSGPITAPAGWTEIRSNSSLNVAMYQTLYYRVATASEPASYAWTWGSTAQASGAILSYSGVDAAGPVDRSGGNGTGTTTSITAPDLSANERDSMLLGVFGIANDSAVTLPVALTSRGTAASTGNPAGNRIRITLGEKTLITSGATGTSTATAGTAAENVGQHVILRRGYFE